MQNIYSTFSIRTWCLLFLTSCLLSITAFQDKLCMILTTFWCTTWSSPTSQLCLNLSLIKMWTIHEMEMIWDLICASFTMLVRRVQSSITSSMQRGLLQEYVIPWLLISSLFMFFKTPFWIKVATVEIFGSFLLLLLLQLSL